MRWFTLILGLSLVMCSAPAQTDDTPVVAAAAAKLHPVPDAPLLPDFVFEEYGPDGQRLERGFVELRGQVVVLVFWATWCGICAGEIPKLDRLQAELGGDGLVVAALSQDREGTAAVRRYFAKRGVKHLRVFHDTESNMAASLGVTGVPSAVIADRDGRMRFAGRGALPWGSKAARKLLRHYLDEAAGASS